MSTQEEASSHYLMGIRVMRIENVNNVFEKMKIYRRKNVQCLLSYKFKNNQGPWSFSGNRAICSRLRKTEKVHISDFKIFTHYDN